MKILLFIASFILLCAERGFAYPQFIQFGYQSCLSCHYNPNGGGPLTDYGRAVGTTAIEDRSFAGKHLTEEEAAERSAFLGMKPANDWLRPSLSYRGLYAVTRTNTKTDERYITMDLSASLVLKFLENDRLIFVGNLAYAPVPEALKNSPEKPETYRSRAHYVGYRLTKDWGVYAGLMDKVFGLRIPDHTSFSRVFPQVTMNDQTHGVLLHGMTKNFELGLQGFVGNLVQDAPLRQKGLTGQVEYSLAKATRVGVSALHSTSDYLGVNAAALHLRTGIGAGGSLLAEVGATRKKAVETSFDTTSHYAFLQEYWLLRQGTFALVTAEYARPDDGKALVNYRLGPGIQYFHFPGIEVRSDLLNVRSYDGSSFLTQSWQLLTQIHAWL